MSSSGPRPTQDVERDAFEATGAPPAHRSELLLAACTVSWALWWGVAWLGSALVFVLRKRAQPQEIDRDL